VSRTLAFKSRLLLLEVFEVVVLEILHRHALYSTIGRLETSNIRKINGPTDRAWPELAGVLTMQRYRAPKLTAAARGGRGRRRGAHRGQNRAVRWRGCAGSEEDRTLVTVLGVEQAEAQRSETRSGTSCGVVL
jgi:hypothetical protein